MTHEPLRQEEDRIHTGRIVTVGVVSLVCFGIGVLWATSIQEMTNGTIHTGPKKAPSEVGKVEIGIVYQSPFDSRDIAHETDASLRARLATYGFTDPGHKTAHIPIDRAMELIVERGKL
jgi:hypothetical protein